jgi:hypothetical protein
MYGGLDKSAFNECIETLSNNKSPGRDGIVNELPGNHTHALHYCVGNWLHTKSLEN